MERFLVMTNATKAQVIVVVNAFIALLQSFGADLTDAQQGAIVFFINAVFALWVGLTYTESRKRQN